MKQTSAADSKPIGWYCPRLGVTWRNPRHHAELCWGDYQCLEKLSPIYLPPPAPVTAEEREPVRTWTCTTPEKSMPKTEKTPRGKQGAIPSFTPLAVPEVTTWGASGGDEAVCCEYLECVDGSGGGGVLDYSLGSDVWRERAISVYDDGEILIHEPVDVRGLSFAYSPCADVASAIRFVDGDDGGLYYNKGEVMIDEKDSRVTATIEPDDCKSGMWMVVLREGNGKLIGIPLRGVDYRTVVFSRQSLGFAFEYGAKHAREVAVKEMNRHWWSVTTPPHEEP